MFGNPTGNGFGLNTPNFTGEFGRWYQNAQSNPTQNNILLGAIGAANFGQDDERTRRAAFSAFLGKDLSSPFSSRANWMARNEARINRLFDSLQLDNPTLRLPDYLARLNAESMYRAASPEETGRMPLWTRTRYNAL